MLKQKDINALFIERVEALLKSKRFKNKREIVDKLEWNETAMSNVLNSRRPVPEEIADKLFKLYNNENISITSEPSVTYRKSSATSNAVLLEENDFTVMMVPLVNKYAYAGYQAGYGDDEYVESLPRVPMMVNKEHKGKYFAFEIKGDSMNNGLVGSYEEGYIVFGREIPQNHWRDKLHYKKWRKGFVIVTKHDGILVKDIVNHDPVKGIITLRSWNSEYEDIEMHLDNVKQLLNVVDAKMK